MAEQLMTQQTPDTYSALFWGYLVIWGLLTVYMVYLGFKCSRLEKKVTALEEGGKASSGSDST